VIIEQTKKRNAAIIAALNDEGQTPAEILRKLGLKLSLTRMQDILREMAAMNQIYTARVSQLIARKSGRKAILLFFKTAEARDRVKADIDRRAREHKQAEKNKRQRAQRRSQSAKNAERDLLRRASFEKRAAENNLREEMRKLREELAAARKAAKTTTRKNFVDQCIVQRRSAEEREAVERRKRADEAMRSAEAIIPAHVKVQILPGTPANRWSVDVPKPRLSDPIGETRSWVDALVR